METGKFTPHARGSTCGAVLYVHGRCVYPACAGIDQQGRCVYATLGGLPRMRGDRPRFLVITFNLHMFTPHARGSTALSYR